MNRSIGGIVAMGLLSFLFGCGEKEVAFQQRGGGWYYRDLPIEDADAKSFQVLNDNYAKDKNQVYYGDTYRKGQEFYTIKHSRLRVLHADPATFRYLDYDYSKDKFSVFYEGVAFPVKDVGTFVLIDRAFARDRISAYFHQRPIPGSDGSTFKVIDGAYSKDARQVFYSRLEPHGTDPIRRSTLVKGAQPDSFKIINHDGYAADAAQVYYRGEFVTKDVASFQLLARGYAKTATRIYYGAQPVQGADVPSFETLEPISAEGPDAKDRNGSYKDGQRAKPD